MYYDPELQKLIFVRFREDCPYFINDGLRRFLDWLDNRVYDTSHKIAVELAYQLVIEKVTSGMNLIK